MQQDVATAKALGGLAADVGTWAYRNSAVNQLSNPADYIAAQQENAVMAGKVVEKAKATDKAEDVADAAGPEKLGDVVYGGRVRMAKVVSAPFNWNPAHPYDDFIRQLRGQETGLNDLTVHDFISNRDEYIRTGRSTEGSRAQTRFREQAHADKVAELRNQGHSRTEARSLAISFVKLGGFSRCF